VEKSQGAATMTSTTSGKAYWGQFFKAAGIVPSAILKYAQIFEDNRMNHKTMLGDLTRECLKDLGIIPMGDRIAIERYAKRCLEEMMLDDYSLDEKADERVVIMVSPSKKGTPSVTQSQVVVKKKRSLPPSPLSAGPGPPDVVKKEISLTSSPAPKVGAVVIKKEQKTLRLTSSPPVSTALVPVHSPSKRTKDEDTKEIVKQTEEPKLETSKEAKEPIVVFVPTPSPEKIMNAERRQLKSVVGYHTPSRETSSPAGSFKGKAEEACPEERKDPNAAHHHTSGSESAVNTKKRYQPGAFLGIRVPPAARETSRSRSRSRSRYSSRHSSPPSSSSTKRTTSHREHSYDSPSNVSSLQKARSSHNRRGNGNSHSTLGLNQLSREELELAYLENSILNHPTIRRSGRRGGRHYQGLPPSLPPSRPSPKQEKDKEYLLRKQRELEARYGGSTDSSDDDFSNRRSRSRTWDGERERGVRVKRSRS